MLRNKLLLFILEFCCFLCALKGIFYSQTIQKREEQVTRFFQDKKDYGGIENTFSFVNKEKKEYLGILEIPTIDLKTGFFGVKSPFNTVEHGLQVIENSKMPDEKGNFILASHSGTSIISYFKNIHTLKQGDLVYIYYKQKKYIYQIELIYEERKDGSITLPKVREFSLLTLTTCKEEKQLLVISKQIGVEDN